MWEDFFAHFFVLQKKKKKKTHKSKPLPESRAGVYIISGARGPVLTKMPPCHPADIGASGISACVKLCYHVNSVQRIVIFLFFVVVGDSVVCVCVRVCVF